MLRTLVTVIVLIPIAVFARPMHPQGVWSGTIGSKAIIACFNKASNFTSYASYYYKDYLTPIRLTKNKEESYWHEINDTGLWKISDPVNGIITGVWRNPDTQKKLRIKLNFMDGRDDETACARDSYNLRLESNPKVKVSKLISFSSDRKYRELRFAGQVTIELFGPDPAIEKINSILRLTKSKEVVDNYFRQRRQFLGRVGIPAADEKDIEIEFWDENFISIRLFFSTAGMGRNGVSNEYRIWSTKSGEEIDLWQWVGDGNGMRKLPTNLKEFLYRNVKNDYPGCVDGYQGQGYFTIRLIKTGLNFFEEAYGDGCEKNFNISFDQLFPFLSPSGKQAVGKLVEKLRE